MLNERQRELICQLLGEFLNVQVRRPVEEKNLNYVDPEIKNIYLSLLCVQLQY